MLTALSWKLDLAISFLAKVLSAIFGGNSPSLLVTPMRSHSYLSVEGALITDN